MAGVREAWQRAQPALAALRARVAEGRVPSWVLGGAIALLTWWWKFNPLTPGVDSSWQVGLQIATHRGLDFGTEVVFTHGPLGFLNSGFVGYGDLAAITFCFQAALYFGLATSLVWALRGSLPMLSAAVVAYLALALLQAIENPVVVPAVICLGLLARERSDAAINSLVVGGALLAAVETLIKLSWGPVVFAVCLLALIGMRARWWQLAAYLSLFLGGLVALWAITGQSIAELPDFVRNSREIVSGYSEAMAINTAPAWQAVVAALALAAIVTASIFGRYAEPLGRWCAAGVVAIVGFLLFKEGVVRYSPGHLTAFFSTVCVLWLAIPWSAARRGALGLGAIALAVVSVHLSPVRASSGLDAIANLTTAEQQVRTLFSPSRRAGIEAQGRDAMRAVYQLDGRILAELRGHTVSIDPWEIGVAWAYGLDWHPLPVFQNYSAYTQRLDDLNAAALASPSGPQRILRENAQLVYPEFESLGADGRFPGWDPPAQARAMLCHFVPLSTDTRWQVLDRVADRCGAPRFVSSVETAYGETVDVPVAGRGEVVFARIHGAGVGGLERLRAVLLRAKLRYAVLDGSHVWRLVPGTAGDGLLLRGDPRLATGGAFSLIPQAETIELMGAGGELRFDFFRMAVRPARANR